MHRIVPIFNHVVFISNTSMTTAKNDSFTLYVSSLLIICSVLRLVKWYSYGNSSNAYCNHRIKLEFGRETTWYKMRISYKNLYFEQETRQIRIPTSLRTFMGNREFITKNTSTPNTQWIKFLSWHSFLYMYNFLHYSFWIGSLFFVAFAKEKKSFQ